MSWQKVKVLTSLGKMHQSSLSFAPVRNFGQTFTGAQSQGRPGATRSDLAAKLAAPRSVRAPIQASEPVFSRFYVDLSKKCKGNMRRKKRNTQTNYSIPVCPINPPSRGPSATETTSKGCFFSWGRLHFSIPASLAPAKEWRVVSGKECVCCHMTHKHLHTYTYIYIYIY